MQSSLREVDLLQVSFRSSSDPDNVCLDVVSILDGLSFTKRLETLRLSDPLPANTRETSLLAARQTVELPLLRTLLDALLPRVHIPDNCAVRIGQLLPPELERCLGYLGSSRRATHMSIESAGPNEGRHHQRRSLVLADPEHGHYTRLDVSLFGPTGGGYSFCLPQVLSLLLFQDIRHLYVDTTSVYVSPREIFEFAALPKLEVLAIRPGTGESVWGTRRAKDLLWVLETTESCPQLATLVCGAQPPGVGDAGGEDDDEDESYFRRFVGARERMSHPLHRLLVWQASGESVRALREYSGDGVFVCAYEGEEATALAWWASLTLAPPGCPDWMEEQMYHPSITV